MPGVFTGELGHYPRLPDYGQGGYGCQFSTSLGIEG
jgi:hypothetical protein